jgi:ABC-type multidrug transport system ATPase subunit
VEQFDAFLSYAGADSELASWLHTRLEASGLRVFFDKYDLEPGTLSASGLAAAVRHSTYFVPLVTATFAQRKWPLYEIESALSHAPVGKVIPVLYGVALNQMPDVLRPFTALTIARDGESGESVDVLIAALRGENVPALRRQRREPRPDPRYPDAGTRDVGERLREMYRERALAEAAGQDTSAITQRVLALRREIRSGPQLRAGDHLGDGRFELIEIIGSGGFATVWKAYDDRDQRVVAVKMLHGQHHRDASMVERFFRGARTMAQLHHPGIASIVEAKGQEDGYLYSVMEYLPGGDLRHAVANGRLHGADGIRLLLVVGEALEFAHRKGLVHRDVKPDNILLDQVGGPRLTDFDLVRDATTTGGTLAGAGLGTFMYAAPEARLDASNAGPAADVYSLGMTALFVLFGGEMPPLAASRPEDVLEQSNGGRTLRKVVARAIAFEARERFASVELFCDALREALDSGEASTAPWSAVSAAPPRPLLLSAHNVRLQFGDQVLVRDLSLAILRGELVGIFGSSGSGATTLFRVLAGRLRPSQGDVRLRGLPVDPSRTGLVDDEAFAPGLTVGELLHHHIAFHTGDRGADTTRARALLESVDLDNQVLKYRPTDISGGMRTRVAIALELAADPEILFLDHARSDLDPHAARHIVNMCRARAARGQTTVMTLRGLSDAELYLFDRIIVLNRGELVWSGPPHEAIGWFERYTGTPLPTTRTALDFLHEASGEPPRTDMAFTTSPEYEQYVGEPLRRHVAAPAASTSTPHRLGALRRLYAQQMRGRWTYLMIRLAQPPLLAVLVLLLAQRLLDLFDFVFFSGVTAVVWFGVSGAATEIVRERTFLLHQREGGTPPHHPAIVWALGIVATLSGLAGSAVIAISMGTGQRAPAGWLVSISLVTGAIVVLAPRLLQAFIGDDTRFMLANALVAGVAIVPAYLLAIRAAAWGR